MDLAIYLGWITRMTVLGWTGVLASIVTGILIFTGVISSPVWSLISGVAAGIALILSIALLWNMSSRRDELEESLRSW